MAWEYLSKLLPALFLLLAGILIAGDPVSQRRIIGLLASWGMANDDSEESVQASAQMLVKIFFGLSLFFFLWTGVVFYHHHRTIKVRPFEDSGAVPYKRPSKPQPKVSPAPSAEGESSETGQSAPTKPSVPYTTYRFIPPAGMMWNYPPHPRSEHTG